MQKRETSRAHEENCVMAVNERGRIMIEVNMIRPLSCVMQAGLLFVCMINRLFLFEQTFYFAVKVFYLQVALMYGVVLGYEEEGRYYLHVVRNKIGR